MRSVQDVRRFLIENEWDHRTHFRERIAGVRDCAQIALNPGTGPTALNDIASFRQFLDEWSTAEREQLVTLQWEERRFRVLGQVRVPNRAVFETTVAVARFIGERAVGRLERLQQRLQPFAAISHELQRSARRQVHGLEALPPEVCAQIARAISQMRRGMGDGLYLRALPLDGVDTKLIERHRPLVESILDESLNGEVKAAGGLLAWLGCRVKGEDRIMIRLLCEEARSALWGCDKLWVTSDTLSKMTLQADRVVIVENDVSGLTLPEMQGTVAVIGCGANLGWMSKGDLGPMRVAYWGDLDSWGLNLLARARRAAPHLEPLMMDRETWDAHRSGVVVEAEPCECPTKGLTETERDLFAVVRGDGPTAWRLEQEKLSSTWVSSELLAWLNGVPKHRPIATRSDY